MLWRSPARTRPRAAADGAAAPGCGAPRPARAGESPFCAKSAVGPRVRPRFLGASAEEQSGADPRLGETVPLHLRLHFRARNPARSCGPTANSARGIEDQPQILRGFRESAQKVRLVRRRTLAAPSPPRRRLGSAVAPRMGAGLRPGETPTVRLRARVRRLSRGPSRPRPADQPKFLRGDLRTNRKFCAGSGNLRRKCGWSAGPGTANLAPHLRRLWARAFELGKRRCRPHC